jgi:hypothetical protein
MSGWYMNMNVVRRLPAEPAWNRATAAIAGLNGPGEPTITAIAEAMRCGPWSARDAQHPGNLTRE